VERFMINTEPDGTILFRVFLPHASRVELLGDFTGWKQTPVQMIRENPGWWSARVAVPAGDHNFAYLVDGAIWLADYAAHGVKLNGFGGWTSRISVDPSSIEAKPRALTAA
jgi:1,4-alpha-glucan branching enzyme